MPANGSRQMAALLRAYKTAVVRAAEEAGLGRLDFGEALLALPSEKLATIRKSFEDQAEKISQDPKEPRTEDR